MSRLLILIDDSLSMIGVYSSTATTYLDTAKAIASNLLDVLVSSRLEVLVQAQSIFIDNDTGASLGFVRDWKKLRSEIDAIQVKDKSDFFAAIMKASRILMGNDEEQAGHIVYLTDGRLMTKNFSERIEIIDACMPGSLHILTLGSKVKENHFTEQIVQRVKDNGKRASLVALDLESSGTFAQELFNNEFAPLTTTLRIGKLECGLSVHPRPPGIASGTDTMDLIGFLPVEQLSGPPLETRHLIVPDGESPDEPHLVVLLNEALTYDETLDSKVTDQTKGPKVGLVKIGPRYGLLQPQPQSGDRTAGSKHKRWLAFWLFPSGEMPIPWFGPLNALTNKKSAEALKFPIQDDFAKKRSYATPTIAWTQDQWITNDFSKVTRTAKKLPDKQVNFYKEINKIRKAALSYGFHDLIGALAEVLEREGSALMESKPLAAAELSHAVSELRRSVNQPYDFNIHSLSSAKS